MRAEALAGFDVVLAPTEDPDNREFRELCVPYLNDPACYADNARLFPHLLARVFKAVAAAEGGVVIHCSAGRDRSGMIAAMLQDLAGDSDEAIVSGYQRSMRGINEHLRHAAVPHPHERFLPENVLVPLLESRRQEPAAICPLPQHRGLPLPPRRDDPGTRGHPRKARPIGWAQLG